MKKRDLYLKMYNSGISIEKIAKKFNIKPASVSYALRLANDKAFAKRVNHYSALYKKKRRKRVGKKIDKNCIIEISVPTKYMKKLCELAIAQNLAVKIAAKKLFLRSLKNVR